MEIGLVPLYPEIDTDIIEIEIEIVTQPSATNNPYQPNNNLFRTLLITDPFRDENVHYDKNLKNQFNNH